MEGASSVDFNTARNLLVQGSNENSNNEREKAEAQFVRLILSIDKSKVTNSSFAFLFEMLVAVSLGAIKQQDQLDFYDIFFRLMDKIDPEQQVDVLKKLNAIVLKYTRVKVYCVQKGWITRILQRLFEDVSSHSVGLELVTVCGNLCAFSVSVREVRMLLRLMKSQKSDRRPLCWPVMLSILQKSAEVSPNSPPLYFDSSGVLSGISLPAFSKLPSSGLSFAAMLRVESFSHPSLGSDQIYEPCIFALCDDKNCGIVVFFSLNFIAIQSISTGKRPVKVLSTFPFKQGQWYHVMISWEYHMIGSDVCSLFIDGQLKGQYNIPYPKNSSNLTKSSVLTFKTDRISNISNLIGQISQFIFIDGPLTNEQVKALNAIRNWDSLPRENNSILKLTNRVSVKLFAFYSPRAVDDALVLDTIYANRNFHALKMEGTAEVHQSDISEAIVCCGGPQILLPLFVQLDLPYDQAMSFGESDGVTNSTDCSSILDLLGASLRHKLALQTMYTKHGFHILGHLLMSVSPKIWDERSFHSLEMLGVSLENYEQLHRAFFINIYLNFAIWIYSPVSVQKQVAGAVTKQVTKKPEYFRRMITVQRIVDIVRIYYWCEATVGSAGVSEAVNMETGEILGERARDSDLLALRQSLLHIARLLTNNSPTLEEIRSLFIYVILTPDAPNEAVDVIQLLLAFLNEQNGEAVAKHLYNCIFPSFGPLVSLSSRKSESLCVWSIKLIAKVLQLLKLDSMEANQSLDMWMTAFKMFIQERHLTKDLYFVMLELLLGTVDTVAISNPILPTISQKISQPHVVSALWQLLAMDDRAGARLKCFTDLLHLLTCHDVAHFNRSMIVNESGWERRLVMVLVMCEKSGGSAGDEAVVLDVVSVMLQHCLMEGDWSSVSRLLANLELLVSVSVRVKLYGKVAEQLALNVNEVSAVMRNKSHVLSCLSKWLYDVHIILFLETDGVVPLSMMNAVATLLEAVLMLNSEKKDEMLWSVTFRIMLQCLRNACSILDAANIAEREQRMGEMEAVILGGMETVAQPVVDAISKYKAGKTKDWRREEQQCSLVFNSVSRRFHTLVPQYASRFQSESTDVLVASLSCLFESLSSVQKSASFGVDPVKEAILSVCGALEGLGVIPSGSKASDILQWMTAEDGPLHDQTMKALRQESKRKEEVLAVWHQQADERCRESNEFSDQVDKRDKELIQRAMHVWKTKWETVKAAEMKRRKELSRSTKNKSELLKSEWRFLVNDLSAESGVWSGNTGDEERTHVMLHKSESQKYWRRTVRKKNKHFDPHANAAKSRHEVEEEYGNQMIVTNANDLTDSFPELSSFVRKGETIEEEMETDKDEGDDAQQNENSDSIIEECTLINTSKKIKGTLEVSRSSLIFNAPNFRARSFDFSQVIDIQLQRYLSRKIALQFDFFGKNKFFVFNSTKVAIAIYRHILSAKPPALNPIHTSGLLRRRTPPKGISRLNAEKWTERWVHGAISNFEYLMKLNKMSGRTYADLSQYPVMPWILTDYESEHLDLQDVRVYRDLSLPAGALNPAKREMLKERYKEAKFHHGTHYSNSSSVLYWMIRVEPFTTMHLELQGGTFDHPDRLFFSIANTFEGVWNNPSDCKELIPELFYDVSMLKNDNKFRFGKTQKGVVVDDVILPRWADSAESFISLHRKALESEYVSQNLHKWIDLVFGEKQRGQKSVDSLNVYFWLTYPDVVDWSLADETSRKSLLDQIEHFGICPDVLFKHAHPVKRVKQPMSLPLKGDQSSIQPTGFSLKVSQSNSRAPSAAIKCFEDNTIVIVYAGGKYAFCTLQYGVSEGKLPFRFEGDKYLGTPKEKSELPFKIGVADGVKGKLHINMASDKYVLYFCGNWDNCYRAFALGSNSMFTSQEYHLDQITCMDVSTSGCWGVTGSVDSTVLVWNLLLPQKEPIRGCGHENSISSVHLNEESNVFCSASKDGVIILRELHTAKVLRTYLADQAVVAVKVSNFGLLLAATKSHLFVWNIALAQRDPLYLITHDSAFVDVVCLDDFVLVCFVDRVDVYDELFRSKIHVFECKEEINCVTASYNQNFIICGHNCSKISVFLMDNLK